MFSPDRSPAFAILDVVSTLLPEEDGGLGIVHEIRWYGEGRQSYTYTIGPLDPDDEMTGGVYGEHQLIATGRRAPLEHFWTEPHMARQIVRVSEQHPSPKLHGLIGVITDQVDEEGMTYSVLFIRLKNGDRKTRARDIPTAFLEMTDHRLPPPPVPRPETTFRRGRDDANVWPSHEFDIVDELDQYL